MDSLNLSLITFSYEVFSSTMVEGLSIILTGVTYNASDYLDDPTSYISSIRTKLDSIENFAYDRVVVISSKSSFGNSIVIVIQGASYQDAYWLSGSALDSLESELATAINAISGHSHLGLVANTMGREL